MRTIATCQRAAATIAMAVLTCQTSAHASVASDFRGIDVRLKACMAKDDSNAGMNACTGVAYDAASRVLKGVYEGQVAKLGGGSSEDRETLKRLVSSERAWVTYRDADCKLQGVSMLGGSGEGLVIVECLYEVTTQRAKSLDKLFNTD